MNTHKKTYFGLLTAVVLGSLFGPVALASSWSPTLLVNTEAMQIIDEGDGATDIAIQFGDTLSKNLTYDITETAFTFDDDLTVGGNVTASGTFSGSSLVVSDVANCNQVITNNDGQFICGTVVSLTGGSLATIQIRRDSNFTMPALNTFYDIPFNNTDTESDGTVLEHNNVQTERIDVKQNGFYLVSYHVNANDAGVTHELDARVRINNTTTLLGSLTVGRNYQNEYSPNVSTNVVFLNANDFLTLQVERSTANTVINETVLTVTKLNGIQGAKGDKGDPGDLSTATANTLFVSQSGDTMTGSLIISNGAGLSAQGSITTDTNLTINNDNGAADAVLTFGNDLGAETLRFSDSTNQFVFSDDLTVGGNVTASGTFSGSSLVVSDVANCNQVITNNDGQFICGTVVSLTGGSLATIQIRRDSNFTMPALNTFYDIPFNNTDTESDGTVLEHNNVQTERIDVKQNGFYLVSYHVNANDAGVTHELDARVRINNTTTLLGSLTVGRNYQNEYSPNVSTNVVFLNANDFLTLQVERSTANTVINETVLTVTKLNGIQGAKGDKGDPGDLSTATANTLFVSQSGDTMTGSLIISNGAGLSAQGSITTDTNLTINNDNGAADAVLTFGNDLGAETLRFSDSTNQFVFSDDLAVQGVLSGTTLIASDTANCTRVVTNANGQISCGSANYYDVYDNTGGQNTATTTTINLDTQRFANANFSLAADEVTVLSTGLYEVSFTFSADSGDNTRSVTRAWLEQNNGVLFTEVDGSRCWIYNRTTGDGEGSCTRTMLLTITTGNRLRIRAVSPDGADKSTLADGTSLTIKRLY